MSESKCKYDEIKDYKSAFECFKQRFLIEKKSIFDLSDIETECKNEKSKNHDCCILTQESVNYLVENFINNGYGGDASFIDKIKYQLITQPTNEPSKTEEVQKKALEVLATAYYIWRIVPFNAKMETTKKGCEEILNLFVDNQSKKTKVSISEENKFFNTTIKGFASVGTYYNTNKPFELAFIIQFFQKHLENEKNDIDILNSIKADEKIGYIKITTASENDMPLILNKSEEKHKVSDKAETKLSTIKSVSIYNALLYLLKPEEYEAIVSNDHKKGIIKAFEDKLDSEDKDCKQNTDDEKLRCIKTKLQSEYEDLKEELHFFYTDEIRELWDPTILPAKNVIYYGAPGTGKTYELKELIERKTKDKSLYKIVQFHPSYNYEDFIDGIKPVGNKDGNIQLELVNGIFKKMCIEAYKNLKEAKDDKTKLKNYYFVADEINRAELSRVFGELLLCLEDDKRLRFEKGELKGELVKTQNEALWKDDHAVVNIDNELYFGVPENIYFLGTMNDIDRSIDSFDLALRRRFKWVHKGCNYDVITEELLKNGAEDDAIVEYLSDGKEKDVSKGRSLLLNEYISNTLNLGKSYELGHTYFMKIKIRNGQISKTAYENLFDQEIGPLVTEYLRAEYPDGKELENKLKEMRNIFTTGKKSNNDKNS